MNDLVADCTRFIDGNGYPNEAAEDRIRTWPIECLLDGSFASGYPELMAFVRMLWRYADVPSIWRESDVQDGPGRPAIEYAISTVGWSGNELLIRAMRENVMFWSRCWVQSRRGGHYIFNVEQ